MPVFFLIMPLNTICTPLNTLSRISRNIFWIAFFAWVIDGLPVGFGQHGRDVGFGGDAHPGLFPDEIKYATFWPGFRTPSKVRKSSIEGVSHLLRRWKSSKHAAD